MQARPRNDKVLLRLDGKKSDLSFGLEIPPSAKDDAPAEGWIVALGPDEKLADLKVGQHVLFAQYAGDDVILEGVRHRVVSEESVLAVLDN